MYAPTEDKADTEKEKFYDDLKTVIDRTPKSDTLYFLVMQTQKLWMMMYKMKSVGNICYMNYQAEMGRCY